jgi:hypothetical protein
MFFGSFRIVQERPPSAEKPTTLYWSGYVYLPPPETGMEPPAGRDGGGQAHRPRDVLPPRRSRQTSPPGLVLCFLSSCGLPALSCRWGTAVPESGAADGYSCPRPR